MKQTAPTVTQAALADWLKQRGYTVLETKTYGIGTFSHRNGLPVADGVGIGDLANPHNTGGYILFVTPTEVIEASIRIPYAYTDWTVHRRLPYSDEATLESALRQLTTPNLGMWASRIDLTPPAREAQIQAQVRALLALCAGDEAAILDVLGEQFPAGSMKQWLLAGSKSRYTV